MADKAPEPVHLISPTGEVVAVNPADAQAAVGSGYTVATPKQAQEFQLQKKYGSGGQGAVAALEGFGDALTLGGSTALERAAGVPAEDIKGREEAHGVLHGIGTGLGIAAPIVATLGAAAPAEAAAEGGAGIVRGAAKLTAPALVSKAGTAVTKGVEAVLPRASGMLGKVAARAVATGAGNAVEGAFYGLGQVVHEAALGDPNLTAQNALATIGLSAALGGGIGGLVGGIEAGVPAAVEKAREATTKLFATANGEGEGILAKALSTVSGKDEGAISELIARRAELVDHDPEAAKKIAGQLKESLGEQYDSVEAALRQANRDIRPAETEQLAASADRQAVKKEYLRLQDQFQAVRDEMLAKPELYPQMYPAKLEQIRTAMWRDYSADVDPAEAFGLLNDTKRLLDPLAKFGKMASPEHADAIAAIKVLRGDVKQSLENEAVWGQAGSRQAAFNDAQSDYFNARKEYQKRFMEPYTAPGGGQAYRMKPEINPAQLMKRGEAIDEYLRSSKALIDEIEASHKTVNVTQFDRGALTDVVNKSGDLVQQARQDASLRGLVKSLQPAQPITGLEAAGQIGIGHALFGPAGSVVAAGSAGLNAVKNVPRTVAVLANLERMGQRVAGQIDHAAASLVAGRAATVGRAEVTAGLARSFGQDAKEAAAQFAKRTAEVSGLANDPMRLQGVLANQAKDLDDHAPNTSQAMQVTSARAVSFLASKVPHPAEQGPLAAKWTPSPAEVAKFNRYYEAVQRPTSVLKAAAAGTLTPEAVEALATVYPQLYSHIQTTLLSKLSGKPGKVPYKSRLMTSMLLGHDLDGSTRGSSILMNQMALTGPSHKSDGLVGGRGGMKSTQSGLAKLTLSNRMETPMQSALGRGRR